MRNGTCLCKAGHFFLGHAAGFGVSGEDIVHAGEPGARRTAYDGFDYFWNSEERQAVFEKRGHGNFVGCVQGTRQCPALFQGFPR